MTDPSWWPNDEETRNLLLRFFLNFATFEYAMKNGGYGTSQRGYYEPDWNKLKSAVSKQTVPVELNEAKQYLNDQPPQKQTAATRWSPPTLINDNDWEFLIDCIKTVRNNLFHGGKVPFDPVRDAILIRYSNDIIAALVDAAPPDIAERFHGGGS